MRRLFAAAFVAFAVPATPAAAALDFRPCAATPDYECAQLPVPLNPAAPEQGSLALEVRRLTETRDGRGVLVALAGGPGQGASDLIDDFAGVLAEGLEDRQLIVFDQRGTGQSGALRCPALAGGAAQFTLTTLTERAGRCADELGPVRRFYTTTEVVADLEALRAALGTDRMAIYGVSYGAYVAQRYARAFPAQVDRLVLDSPVAQDQDGPFDVSSYAAAARLLRRLCGPQRCLVDRLVKRLPLDGTAFDARGRPVPVAVEHAGELFDLLVASDFSPALRAALPSAFTAAARGDAAPLLRLVHGDEAPAGDPPEEFSDALFFTTTCEEKPQAWGSPLAPLAERAAQWTTALAALGSLAPFGPAAAASTQVGTAFCAAWPPTAAAAPPAPAKLEVQALVLAGTEDLRTPWEGARRTVAGLRDGTLVRVPGAGHAVVSQSLPCVQTALERFFAGSAVGNPCDGRAVPRAAPAPPAPRSLTRGADVAAAVLGTVADAVAAAAIPGPLSEPYAAGGLRGGHFCARPGERGTDGRRPLLLELRADRHAPRLAVSGRAVIARGRLTQLSVTLAGAHRGRLRLAGRRLVGNFGGRSVRATAASLRMPPLTVPSDPDRAGAC